GLEGTVGSDRIESELHATVGKGRVAQLLHQQLPPRAAAGVPRTVAPRERSEGGTGANARGALVQGSRLRRHQAASVELLRGGALQEARGRGCGVRSPC